MYANKEDGGEVTLSDECREFLDALLKLDKPPSFGPSFVQRHCHVGYPLAVRVLEFGVKEGVLKHYGNYQYVIRGI